MTGFVLLAAASVKFGMMELKTYPFSDPDPVPATEKGVYPYTRFNGSTWDAVPRKWKTVTLENDRIRVVVTPEIGGKVWGATDKKTGVDFIYFNHVAKFRDIAQCGPWTSGGIEFNFGIVGHSPTCSSPVACTTAENADGSVSCFVGATEWVCGTTWQVEIRLGAEDDFFETRTTWHNGSGFPEPYYQWMNAAFHLEEKAQFDFPGTHEIFHDGKADPWPVDAEGRDVSIYGNNAFGGPKSYHVINGDNGHYGIWWPSKNVGAYHENAVGEKYGRKIWLWALSREGGIWEDLLTDSDGQYAELQSGRMFHQPQGTTWQTPFKHATFEPGRTDRFTERWGVMRTPPTKRDASEFAQARPLEMPKDFDWDGVYGLYLKGVQDLRCGGTAVTNGVASLEKCLAKDPHYAPALDELALFAAKRGHFTKARAFARQALAIDTYDAAANYADGLVALAKDDLATARERLGLAAYSPVYRASATVLLAKIEMRCGDWKAALAFAEKARNANPLSPDAVLAHVVVLRQIGLTDSAKTLAKGVLSSLSFCRGAQYEAGEPMDGVTPEELVALGAWYEEAGLVADAVKIYALAGDDMIAGIRRAHLEKGSLAALAKRPVAFVRPFRASSRPAFEWAVKNGGNWRFTYLLAVLEAANGDNGKARSLLESCGETPNEATFYLYRAKFRTGAAKLADLTRAQQTGDSWRVGYALCEQFDAAKDYEAMRRTAETYLRASPKNNALELMYAASLNKLKRYAECVAFLKTVRILPSEHGRNGTALWIEANRALGDEAAAESYPENLGRGKPFPKATAAVL